ncbi:MAG: DUF4214 domain-containing protein [Acidimicrobiales bacterium]|nr:DUF4214 domain-containing protein [Acidimicrobiales bacterium]
MRRTTTLLLRLALAGPVLLGVLAIAPADPAGATRSPFPFASWSDLVDQQYADLLGRAPSTGERDAGIAQARDGGGPGALIARLRSTADQTGAVDPLVRLYLAYVDRAPDPGGLDFWIARRRNGTWPLVRVSQQFASSSEFTGIYGSLSDRAFVELVYANVLDRPGDPGGIDYWTRQLDLGRRSRGEVMVGFSESSEHIRTSAGAVTAAVLPVLLLDRAPARATFDDDTARLDDGLAVADYADELLTSTAYARRAAPPGRPVAVALVDDGPRPRVRELDITPDGRFIAYSSASADIVPGDGNGVADVFVWDRRTGRSERISMRASGDEPAYASLDPAISDDGRFVAFVTQDDLTGPAHPGDISTDIYRYDRRSATVELVSVTQEGLPTGGFAEQLDISADGRFVSFFGTNDGITEPSPPNSSGPVEVFVRDMEQEATTDVSGPLDLGDGYAWFPDLSADGNRMAFHATSVHEAPGGERTTEHRAYLWDRTEGLITGPADIDPSAEVTLSDDGSTVLVEVDGQLLAWEPPSMDLEPVSLDAAGSPVAPDEQREVAISGDGSLVVFTDCPEGGSDDGTILVRDRTAGRTVELAPPPEAGQECQTAPALTRDGDLLATTLRAPWPGPPTASILLRTLQLDR